MTRAVALPKALAEQYLEAWQAQDVNAILALHTPDSVFIAAASDTHARGHHAIRDMLADTFAAWPDLHFEPVRLYASDDLIAAESIISMTPALPMTLRGLVAEPTGRTVRCAVVDIMEVRGGLVSRKASYLDALDYVRQLRSADRG